MSYNIQNNVSKAICVWMIFILLILFQLSGYINETQKKFYRLGPNEDLFIMGFVIDDFLKYIAVVFYCCINSMMRTLNSTILTPWLINTVQDESKVKPPEIHAFAYEITCVSSAYHWFDWFIYMNILLSQIDMVLIETAADLGMAILTTKYYLHLGCN